MKKYDTYKDSGIEWVGEIPSHWNLNKVKHNFSFKTGFTPPSGKTEYYEDGKHIWINISDLQEKQIHDSANKITDKAIEDYKPNVVPKGSLLYSFKLSVGRVGFNMVDCYTNEAIFSIDPNGSANLNFFYYSLPDQIIKNANENIYGAKILNQELIKNAFLVVPPPEEQSAIASYLDRKTSEIDELIADKKRLLELYEEEKTAIINQAVTGKWKMKNGKWKMKDSGIEWLGEIPEHWEIANFNHYVFLRHGYQFRNFDFTSEGIKIIKITQLLASGKFETENVSFIDENRLDNFEDILIKEGDILMALTGGTIGKIIRVPKVNEPLLQNYRVGNFFPINEQLSKDFLFWILSSNSILVQIFYDQRETGQPNIGKEDFGKMKIVFPKTIEEQHSIVQYIETETARINQKVAKTEKLIELLTEYRQALISEVVTGKVKVTEG